ncbi:unnamed protein product [Closterium sp. Yama58-4]|nr:unnamed protein product [Closterium sp. Yama58-4]
MPPLHTSLSLSPHVFQPSRQQPSQWHSAKHTGVSQELAVAVRPSQSALRTGPRVARKPQAVTSAVSMTLS